VSKKTSKPKAKKIKPDEAAPAAPKIPSEQKSGITRRREGTACRAIWDWLDAKKVEGAVFTFEDLRAAIDSKTADATLRTQRQRWKQFNA
jgi:hypothetical protein